MVLPIQWMVSPQQSRVLPTKTRVLRRNCVYLRKLTRFPWFPLLGPRPWNQEVGLPSVGKQPTGAISGMLHGKRIHDSHEFSMIFLWLLRLPDSHFNEVKSSFESVATRSFGAVEWMAVPRYVASRGKIVGNHKHHDTHDSSKHIQPHSNPSLHKLLPLSY